ncbi:MAG: M78 family metallopeptidase domain-containing protein [Vulcanimicrobiaceae bacterium]
MKLAREYGVEVQFADLGDWGVDELRSEYDPHGPLIRINVRIAEQLAAPELGEFVTFSIGHELYHHREHIGEVPHLPERKLREIAANDFARTLLERS